MVDFEQVNVRFSNALYIVSEAIINMLHEMIYTKFFWHEIHNFVVNIAYSMNLLFHF